MSRFVQKITFGFFTHKASVLKNILELWS